MSGSYLWDSTIPTITLWPKRFVRCSLSLFLSYSCVYMMTQFLEDELSNGLCYGIHHRYGLFHIFFLFLRILVKSNYCKRKAGAWLCLSIVFFLMIQSSLQFFDYGVETSICVLKTCFTFWKGGHTNTLQLENVVSLVLKRVLEMPNFATLLSCALQDFEVTPEFVTAFHSDASTSGNFP